MTPIMACGHAANGTTTATDGTTTPACVICSTTQTAAQAPSIEGRMMVCCIDPIPSRREAAFFQYRGPGSSWPADFDEFYCGHAGWD